MHKIVKVLSSMALMGSLFIVLALVLAIATFVENDFGTNAANALVYKTWWFELIFVILAINMFLNLTQRHLWRKDKLPMLLFHLAFFIIIVGAAITRYTSYEGSMHIREGESSNKILSSDCYISIDIKNGSEEIKSEKVVLFSEISKNQYNESFQIGGKKITIKSVDYIKNATLKPSSYEGGKPLFTLVIAKTTGREEVYLAHGDQIELNGVTIGFNSKQKSDVSIDVKDGAPTIVSNDTLEYMAMQTQTTTQIPADSISSFYSNVLYSTKGVKFVLTNFIASGALLPVSMPREMASNYPDAVILKMSDENNNSTIVTLFGATGAEGKKVKTELNGNEIEASLGSKIISIPFELHLKDFQIERYLGSHSPSSFASEVTLKDGETVFDKRIYMNNILNYSGYRFYQSSYDVDELGTVLSVNRDYAGTILTYIGYLLLTIGMLLALVMPNTRFRYLLNQTRELASQKRMLTLLAALVLGVSSIFAETINPPHPISIETAAKFGALWVQDNGGRLEPLNTLNNEIARKLVKHNSFKDYNSDQLLLSIMVDPQFWQNEKIITVSNPELQEKLGLQGTKASFNDFLTPNGGYKIQTEVENAFRNKASARNKMEQDAIKVDEQMNVFYMAQTGSFLKIYPNPKDLQASWVIPGTTPIEWSKRDSLIVSSLFSLYIDAILKGDSQRASEYIGGIEKFQNEYAATILPSETRANIEIAYNNSNLFLWLSVVFFILGILMLIFQFISLLLPKHQFKLIIKIGFYTILTFFTLQTIGMAVRWYLSDHAPWSNGYESMLYIAWCIILSGLIFYKKSDISLSITALFSGVVLMVAHLSWMNPEITNLVPVLKSYWLTIHVAIIVASYGFLSLGALLGFINLILIGLKSEKNYLLLNLTVKELTAIAEITLTVGLYLLTVGAFLGGVWANESWGRYWGWDPKETWSIITVFFYTFILHMRFIPSLKDIKIFNFAALLGFSSVIMTYLGVNYYLAGMHSYAKGDPVPVPVFVYYSLAIIFIISFYAFYNDNALKEKIEESELK